MIPSNCNLAGSGSSKLGTIPTLRLSRFGSKARLGRNAFIRTRTLIPSQGGTSSMVGLLTENGPCRLSDDGSSVSLNPSSFNEVSNV